MTAMVPNSSIVATSTVDYRLVRNAALAGLKEGSTSLESACYSHPELLRAARSYSEQTSDECPLCEDEKLVLVRYVFGPRLPSSGLCVLTAKDFERISRRKGNFVCYVVEVCVECGWNHPRSRFEFQGVQSARSAAAGA